MQDGRAATGDGALATIVEVLTRIATAPGVQELGAVLVVVVGFYVSKLVVRLVARPVARRFERPSVVQTVLRTVRFAVVALFVVLALRVLSFEFGNIVLSVTVFSAVVGIVLAPIVASVINGLFVLADQPFEIGDMVELEDGTTGFVEDITIRYTKVLTLENTTILLQNSLVRDQPITNYSADDERTRLSLGVVVTYESDIPAARDLMERAARNCEPVIDGGPDIRIGGARYPARPTCYIDEYGDHGVLLTLRYWASQPYKLLTVRSQVQERVWDLLDDADVDIAYPHQHHVFDETSGRLGVDVDSASERESSVGVRDERE